MSENTRMGPVYPFVRKPTAALKPAAPKPMMATGAASVISCAFMLIIPFYAKTCESHGPYSPVHMPESCA